MKQNVTNSTKNYFLLRNFKITTIIAVREIKGKVPQKIKK